MISDDIFSDLHCEAATASEAAVHGMSEFRVPPARGIDIVEGNNSTFHSDRG
jgi:hypothetical protein